MKFVLGKTPEELAKEESQRMTEIAEELGLSRQGVHYAH